MDIVWIETFDNILFFKCRFAEKVERNFTFPTFIQICVSGIVICSLANEAARVSLVIADYYQ